MVFSGHVVSISLILLTLHLVFSLPVDSGADTVPRNIIYVQTFINRDGSKLSLLPLLQQKTRVTHVILAAVHIDDKIGEIHLNDNDPSSAYYDWLWPQVKTLQQSGVKVMMMLGGAARGSYQNLQKNFNAYYPPLLKVLRNHSIDGLDLDIEEDVDMNAVLQLLRQLNTDLGHNFILTSAPEATGMTKGGGSLTNFSYFDLDKQAVDSARPNGRLINWYNTQAYNGWGSAASTATYDSMINAGWSPSRIVLGVVDSGSDGGGFVSLNTLKSVIASLRKKYSNFGGVDGWEYFDAGSNDGFTGSPWQWVKQIGNALYDSLSYLKVDITEEDREVEKYARTNFDEQLDVLIGEGIPYINALISLNKTTGNIDAARELLSSLSN